jgi:hypothetical protein
MKYPLKKYSALLIFALFMFVVSCQRVEADAQYNHRIVAPADPNDMLKSAVQDLQNTLQSMTGQKFEAATEYTGGGIFLARSSSPDAPANAAAQLKDKGREPFVIRSADDKTIWIIANGDDGLSHGIYYYLDQLGCRWFFPNSNWTIIPKRENIALKIDTLVAPAFKQRAIGGTGGFGPLSPVDPKLALKDRQYDWQRRNRFGGEYHLGGHSGEGFNLEKKEILLQHPEYLAKVDGQYVPWSLTAKLNTANPDAVKLYVDWSVERFRTQRKQSPNSRFSVAVSVDPADGGGHCNSDECKQIGNGSTSDQVFYVANEVAKAVRKEFPDGYVNLYAYHEHAAVPSFPLEPNVIVSIIPYAFNTTGMPPEDFIRAWGEKIPQLSLYDYWSITDWALDMPSFNYLSTPAEKLRFWNQNQVEGFLAETTYSAGAMGPGWYVASKLMWNPNADEKAIIEDFYDKSFGPAKAPMKRMLERWATSFSLNSQELALSFADMQEAMKLGAGNAGVLARLDDYANYVQYLRLHHEYMLTKGEEHEAARMALLKHIWNIYDSSMVHTFRLYQFLVDFGRIENAYKIFDIEKKDAPGWQDIAPPTHAQVLATLTEGVKDYQPLGFVSRKFTGELVAIPAAARAQMPIPPFTEWSPEMIFLSSTDFELNATPQTLNFPLRLSNPETPIRIKITDKDGNNVFEDSVAVNADWRNNPDVVNVSVPAPGMYKVELINPGYHSIRVQTPRNLQLNWRVFRTNGGAPSPNLYFYVPTGTRVVAFTNPAGATLPGVYGADGKMLELDQYDNGQLNLVEVPAGQDGKVWSISSVASPNVPITMLNVPHVFSLFPDTLLTPKDALQQ